MSKDCIAFGIGCFSFNFKKTVPEDYTVQDYLSKVHSLLASIPNISNIEIRCDESQLDRNLRYVEKYDINPQINWTSIHFDINIPYDLQNDLLHIDKVPDVESKTLSDNFKVSILYKGLPIIMVKIVEATTKNEGSDAIIVVREFLLSEMEKIDDDLIGFEILGPTPFHANFYLKATKLPSQKAFSTSAETKLGYDTITVYYNSNKFEDINEALTHCYRYIDSEFSFYYKIVLMKNSRQEEYRELVDDISELLEIHGETNYYSLWKQLTCSRKLDKAFLKQAKFELSNISYENYIERRLKLLYEPHQGGLFYELVKKLIDEFRNYKFPLKQNRDIINLFQNKRSKRIEIMIILLSAFIGGAIGSIITLLFL